MLQHLVDLGFRPIVTLVPIRDRFAPDDLSWKDRAGWLYAFVSNDKVMYVGLTANVLRSRMDHYRHSVGDQGKRLNRLVLDELAAGRTVKIYGLEFEDPDGRADEEFRLRQEYAPPWNLI